jgi:hypothetical protein
MTFPTIHRNGTSADTLNADLGNAYDALNTAYDAVKKCGPNGRDYYPQPGDALGAATYEHLERLRAIDRVMKELEAIMENINLQDSAK